MYLLHIFTWYWLILCSRLEVDGKILHLLGLRSLGGGWPAGEGTKMALEMAIEDINAKQDVLPGYQLKVVWEDTQCDPGIGVNNMYKELYLDPVKIMIIGAGCSPVTQAIARTSQHWNIITLSYASSSPVLSDTSTYRLFFRLNSPGQDVNTAHVQMMKAFNWKKVATIHQTVDVFSKVTDDLALRLQGINLTLITAEIFTDDPIQQVINLKRHDARIIFVGCFPDKSYKLLCAIYKQGLYGPKYAWVFPGYYDVNWWLRAPEYTDCTLEQITKAVEGVFGTTSTKINHKDVKGLAGYTPSEWVDFYYKRMEGLSHYGMEMGPMTYDSAWSAALALNNTQQILKDRGYEKGLEDFTYEDRNITMAIAESLFQVEFQGIKGYVKFNEKGDNEATQRIWRIQNGIRDIVGHYDPYRKEMEWLKESPIVWEGGKPPADSTINLENWIFVDPTAYITMCLLAGLGIMASLFFGFFNFFFRKERLIKMSSPNMNNLTVAGCIVTYLTPFLQERSDDSVLVFCKIRTYILMVGFSLAFGALFAKTWRVYAIFMNRTKKVVITDGQLFGMVMVLVGIDFIILIIREVVDPMMAKSIDIETVEMDGGDVITTNLAWMCTSQYDIYFRGAIYTIKGLLLIFGAFLAWQTRTVKIPALNDSQYIGVCIYNVAVLSLLGVVLAFALSDKINLSYIFTCSVIIFGTTITQMIIFIPKIVRFRSGNQVEDTESVTTKSSKISSEDQTTSGINYLQLREELKMKANLLQEAESRITNLTSEVTALRSQIQIS